MHRLHSRHSVTRFKLAAWVLLLLWLLIPATVGVLLYSLYAGDRGLTHLALWLMVGSVLVAVIQWLLSLRPHCPLCLAHPIAHRCCSKHRTAKPLCGSYRLRVACTVIFRNYFRCPYCGETTAVEARPDALHPHRRC